MKTSFMMTSVAATIYIDGKKYIFVKDHPNFDRACQAVKAKRWDLIPDLLDLTKTVQNIAPEIKVDPTQNKVTFKGEEAPIHFILNKLGAMDDPRPLAMFLERWASNPSGISREEAVKFFDACRLPLTPDGRFYAWKVVRHDYFDKHSNSFDNSVGKVLSMDRASVDPDRYRHCSTGFHVCSKDYIQGFRSNGDRLMKVIVDPADVVSIPTDTSAKMRVCRYEVVAEEQFENVDQFESAGVRQDHDDLSDYAPAPLAPLEEVPPPMTFFQTVRSWFA